MLRRGVLPKLDVGFSLQNIVNPAMDAKYQLLSGSFNLAVGFGISSIKLNNEIYTYGSKDLKLPIYLTYRFNDKFALLSALSLGYQRFSAQNETVGNILYSGVSGGIQVANNTLGVILEVGYRSCFATDSNDMAEICFKDKALNYHQYGISFFYNH